MKKNKTICMIDWCFMPTLVVFLLYRGILSVWLQWIK